MKEKEILAQYFPLSSVDLVYQWITDYNIHFKISKKRKTKLGDYRPPRKGENHRISINHDLNPFAFLITFIHEVAHLKVFLQFQNRVAPHGKEWKTEYRVLMQPFFDNNSFPEDIKKVLKRSVINSKASSTSDIDLARVLQKYDQPNNLTHLEKLMPDAVFITENGKTFKKGERIRTRFKCLNISNKRFYLFHPLTPVSPVDM